MATPIVTGGVVPYTYLVTIQPVYQLPQTKFDTNGSV